MDRFDNASRGAVRLPGNVVEYSGPVRRPRSAGLARVVASLLLLATGSAGVALAAPAEPDNAAAGARDGAHDFDFNLGVWHTHIRRISDPLSGAGEALELEGTVTVRKVWDGKALLEEIEADGPNGHWEGLSLFLYNPAAHQWSQNFANSKAGMFTTPLIGEFHHGRGELFSSDTFKGRAILVRGVWSEIRPDSHRYEESYSADGGATWRQAFVADLTRKGT